MSVLKLLLGFLLFLFSLSALAVDCSDPSQVKQGYLSYLAGQQSKPVSTHFEIEIYSGQPQRLRDQQKGNINPSVRFHRLYNSSTQELTYTRFEVLEGRTTKDITGSRFRTIMYFIWSDIAASTTTKNRPKDAGDFEGEEFDTLVNGGTITFNATTDAFTYQSPNPRAYSIADNAIVSADKTNAFELSISANKFLGHFDIDPASCMPAHVYGILEAGHWTMSYIRVNFNIGFQSIAYNESHLAVPNLIKMKVDWKFKGGDPDAHTAEIKIAPVR